ncbi:MAG: hypothetical protein IPP61_01865 [Cytophagaceae bacterium]|nr:hypothetical protein [Cytophagaceae bacterium]MBL0301100.1 hypothetical protein [Cytophagaceae bacterium]MBL0323918.1 hypothetical protein [Cytophagaceae bacterium]
MKKVVFLLLWASVVNAQSNIEYALIKNIKPRGQITKSTCWAACIEMLENSAGIRREFQLEYINKKLKENYTYKNFRSISDPKTLVEGIAPGGLYDLLDSRKNKCDSTETLDWNKIKQNFRNKNANPIIVYKDNNISKPSPHFFMITGYLETQSNSKSSTKYLLINDPWVKNLDTLGINYALNYDLLDSSQLSGKQKFFYNFSQKSLNPVDTSEVSFPGLPSTRQRKKFLQSKKRLSIKYARSSISSLPKYKTSFNQYIFGNDSMTVDEGMEVTYLKDKDFENLSKLEFLILSNSENQTSYYNSVKKNGETKFVYVSTNDAYAKKFTAMTERIEPYETSVVNVLDNLEVKSDSPDTTAPKPPRMSAFVSQNNFANRVAQRPEIPTVEMPEIDMDFHKIFYYKSYKSNPDFLLIPLKNKSERKYILIDLFNLIPKADLTNIKVNAIRNFENPIKIKHFNYKPYLLEFNQESFALLQKLVLAN